MRDYKRLTERDGDLIFMVCKNCGYYEEGSTCWENSCDNARKKRLAYLEDKIENGTLIELPCKVGDTVYALREDSFAEDNYKIMWHIAEGFVKKIYLNKKNETFLQIISWVDHKSWSKDSRNYKVTTFGQTVFLTKAEAEKKLEELKGGIK